MKKIIPAIDLYNQKVVRLVQGNFNSETVYFENPLEVLYSFLEQGIDRVHIIDLNGAKEGQITRSPNFKLILDILKECKKWSVSIELGGGIRSESAIESLISQGVDNIIIGTFAFENSTSFFELLDIFKKEIIIALDVYKNDLMIKGWRYSTNMDLPSQLRRFEEMGLSTFIITDISSDGTLSGPEIQLFEKIQKLKKKSTEVIASGGIRTVKDVDRVLAYVDGVIIGKALYNKNINRQELKALNLSYNPTNLIKRIIPCLDVKNGRVVKGVNFLNLRDRGDPVELARYYNFHGADELVFLDISATLEGRESTINIIKEVAEEVQIPFTVGGGIRNIIDMEKIIRAGAEKVCINSAAVQNPDLIIDGASKFGSQSIVVAIDVRKNEKKWEVYIKSGTESTGLDVMDWSKKVVEKGAGELLVTSMDRDGTLKGYDTDLIQRLSHQIPVPIIASGGAGEYDHFFQAIKAGAEAVLAASLFHERTMKIQDLKSYLYNKNIKVRI